MPVREGGWVPPLDEELVVAPPVEPMSELEEAPGRSWSSRQPGAHAAAPGRYRLDPGRRGAVALVVTALLAALVAGGVALRNRPHEVPLPEVEVAGVPLPGASASAAAGGEVVVAVAGKVRKPGLIRLPAGSRVDDAVRAAGGPAAGVDVGVLNLARRLVDGEQVLVGVAAPAGGPGAPAAGAGGLLDLNAASASDLDALPGIGPVLAQRIVDWRTENGRFASVDQLREVTGIGESKYSDIQAKVTV
ncbi:MAG: competence protein ComEA helix-hairpin-helix repeat protein [Frankiales bacterium]|nr:competence protein ComEA helix-hairpin-helix repeat protein [Frankiales bacterium]